MYSSLKIPKRPDWMTPREEREGAQKEWARFTTLEWAACRDALPDLKKRMPSLKGLRWHRKSSGIDSPAWAAWLESEIEGERVELHVRNDRTPFLWIEDDILDPMDDGGPKGPYTQVTGELGGRVGFVTHGLSDRRELPCVWDLADPVGKKEWPDYHEWVDEKGNHREGPGMATVNNREEFAAYLKLTGQAVKEDRGVRPERPIDRLRREFQRKHGGKKRYAP